VVWVVRNTMHNINLVVAYPLQLRCGFACDPYMRVQQRINTELLTFAFTAH